MELHDKDLDRLFRTGLQDLEAEPTAGTWGRIAAGLNQPASKRNMVPYLRIAASVLILLGAGTWLLLKQPEAVIKHAKHAQIAKRVTKYKIDRQQQQPDTRTNTIVAPEKPIEIAVVKKSPVEHHSPNNIEHKPNSNISQQQAEYTQLAAVTAPAHTTLSQPVVPDEIIAVQSVEEKPVFKSIAALPVAQTLALAPAAKIKAKKHGIHSLGDVVNLVVAKVDKRSDKVIEFTDADDDGAVITGINLGLFSIKKEQ